ncbi:MULTISPECIES: ribosome biogenesis GTP-binding protein YihA/YsxC [Aneurinibacillus]|uniref:Probable GTP-binding protein EngB n=1 Tax=Aneurinibacillus thermoaerophilus TaxID=143495 RepID=A0A1G7ZVJ3_ANETH|nr:MULTISPECIES: ribosome biogenesis GTP-binding protein YihA/YsxC [Aneurinibacillus]AMA72084.1 GTP-binding protein [Aneurinibacillus sp. XH2]MED0676366.1 ribosome biogenesis GTP-binding protein YihA/YsxC [Aneurinibacillus thermoaerophilus]MED0678878.1 ribosome biogenesis GTP-binding protein YihA/YsxC [Aneurinibacillus thermoaerophilus]MED0736415.1 ribosome biogenesis GTP-binding protein YihA/YsxC [Aneurinibacillus thermoaerophilus]MED0755918.1 ribosome biogenesis GTP-binding protein YihA/YsxC
MKVTQAEFVISAVSPKQYPQGSLPELALAGRSNVGKSSFINKMANRKNLARTSSKPGKTQTLNYYLINKALYFVDLPGYGYAKVSKAEKAKWGRMMEEYFQTRQQLKAVIHVVDIRHKPTKDDQEMFSYLKHYEIPVIVVATKTDKIPRGKWQKHAKEIRVILGMEKEDTLILFSAETGQGKEEAWTAIWKKIRDGSSEKEEGI